MTVLRLLLVALTVVVLAACADETTDGDADVPEEPVGSSSPELAVSSILRAIGQEDAATLDANTASDQLGLLALVEGASTPDALAALGFAGEQIVSTFWLSFADQVDDFIGSGVDDIRIGEVMSIDLPGASYATVEVMFPLDSADRVFVVTDRGGWVVDLVATFPGAFVPNIPLAIERASSPGVDPELLDSIVAQSTSLDALEAIGVDARMAAAIVDARSEILGGGSDE